MAFKRKLASGAFEYRITRKGLLPKPFYKNFTDEAEGDAFVAAFEAQLDQGIVPSELLEPRKATDSHCVVHVIAEYLRVNAVKHSEEQQLQRLKRTIGTVRLRDLTYRWGQDWVIGMKRQGSASSTIRHYVGALNRCLAWAIATKGFPELFENRLKMLPRGYATYNKDDLAALEELGIEPPEESGARDRRLVGDEELHIRSILDGNKPHGRQRPFELIYQGALELMFDLALETAMRMRESYTLTLDQVELKHRTIFLDKTKNGDKRQVPLSTVAVSKIQTYLDQVTRGERGMAGFKHPDGRLFPWWRGELTQRELGRVTALLSRQFARIFDAAGCPDVHFHDLRHEATSRIYERTALTDLQVSKITGHKDIRMLARYANLRASNLAEKLW